MPFATFKGEASVEEIADRVFLNLTPKQRETAARAILKANPRLKRLKDVPAGVLIEVPDIPALRAKTAHVDGAPGREILASLQIAVKEHTEQLFNRQDRDAERIKVEAAALADPIFRKAISQSQSVMALADEAALTLELRAKTAEKRRKELEAGLGQALTDIEAHIKEF